MFNDKVILITGGTGSFGQKYSQILLEQYSPKKIIIYSRDEFKQSIMSETFNDPCFRYFIGDVRDQKRLSQACEGVDFIIHAAATKIVPTAEINPIECIKTNILGAQNIITATKLNKIKKVVALSTDKACNPINLYGASKLASDKLFISANHYPRKTKSIFSVVRYGNVMGSRGSIIPFFLEKAKTNIFPVTHFDMTRFLITLEEGVNLVFLAFKDMKGGELYVSKIPSVKIRDLPNAINKSPKIKYIGIRPGEKIHERMISEDDAYFTYEYKNYFKILPNYVEKKDLNKYVKNGKKVKIGFSYSSNNNNDWVTDKQLKINIKKIKKELDL